MNKILSLLILSTVTLSNANAGMKPVAMFENSLRRDAVASEKMGIVKMVTNYGKTRGNCTGFFVKNANDRFFIATAQHCAKYNYAKYCNSEGVHITTASGEHKGYCENVLITHPNSDFVIIEARFENPDAVKKSIKFLTLASASAQPGTQLKLIGYPGDEERKGRLTVSEKCYVLEYNSPAHKELTQQDLDILFPKKQTNNNTPAVKAPEISAEERSERAAAKKYSDTIKATAIKQLHNCSVYGGNSGGPVIARGTDIVVGMPMNYIRLPVTRKFSENVGMHFETSRSVYEKNYRLFEDYKIELSNNINGIYL